MLFHSKTANSEIHTVSFDSSLPCHWNSEKSSVLQSGKIQLVFDFLVKTNQLETNHSNCSNQIKQKVCILLLLKCKNQTKLLDIQHGRHTLFNHVREERERRSQAPYDMRSWIFSLPVRALTSAFFDLIVPITGRKPLSCVWTNGGLFWKQRSWHTFEGACCEVPLTRFKRAKGLYYWCDVSVCQQKQFTCHPSHQRSWRFTRKWRGGKTAAVFPLRHLWLKRQLCRLLSSW